MSDLRIFLSKTNSSVQNATGQIQLVQPMIAELKSEFRGLKSEQDATTGNFGEQKAYTMKIEEQINNLRVKLKNLRTDQVN